MSHEDPTFTTTLRSNYEEAIVNRLDRLARLIEMVVGENDLFGFGDEARSVSEDILPTSRQGGRADAEEAFNSWLEEAIISGVLEPVRFPSRGGHWSGTFVRSAQQKAVEQSVGRLEVAGVEPEEGFVDAAFNAPIHTDTLRRMYTRNYQQLKKLTNDTAAELRRRLSDGLAQGHGPEKISRSLTSGIEAIGHARAKTIARTEVIRTHAESTLDSFERAGIDKVAGLAEWLTAEDGHVCARCKALSADGPYTIEEARGMIPEHPNCRCTWIPVLASNSAQ